MNNAKHWHILAYDVRHPRRLRRVHRRLCKSGMPLQESVFLVSATALELRNLLDDINAFLDTAVDDVRTYPVTHPAGLWMSGVPSHLQHTVLRIGSATDHHPGVRTLWTRLKKTIGRSV
jgi:CRISPR-associated protein Cas2